MIVGSTGLKALRLKMSRKQRMISTDQETENIIKTHGINASEEFRKYIKNKYGSVKMMENKLEKLKKKQKELLDKKQEIEQENLKVQREIEQLNNILVKSDVMRQIKNNREYRAKLEQKLSVLKEARAAGDSDEEIKQAIKKNAKLLSEDLPYPKKKLEKILKDSLKL